MTDLLWVKLPLSSYPLFWCGHCCSTFGYFHSLKHKLWLHGPCNRLQAGHTDLKVQACLVDKMGLSCVLQHLPKSRLRQCQKLRIILPCEMKKKIYSLKGCFIFCSIGMIVIVILQEAILSLLTNSSNSPFFFYQDVNSGLKSFATTKEKQCNSLNEHLNQGSTLYHVSALQELASWNCWPDKQFAHTAWQAACLSGLADSHGRKSTSPPLGWVGW